MQMRWRILGGTRKVDAENLLDGGAGPVVSKQRVIKINFLRPGQFLQVGVAIGNWAGYIESSWIDSLDPLSP
jgi:hypothetical protein